ncbi:hypothetical protein DP107_02200 [Haloglomus irregulare]|uniref:Uncharacterized protein n=1 Tax=Haloglomus irregulare TaxID=2234134 RepID=A0A554NFC4_9EURY|nr:hypothetical protein [Haloglomus irregulare]TSD16015.1 hypothetical protein DP107_02200 [Haloglomus irregulare]
MTSDRALWAIDFAAWVAAVSGVVAVAVGVPTLLVGGLALVKQALFVVGVLMFGIGSFGIQPTPSYKEDKRVTVEGGGEADFEERIHDTLPVEERLPFDDRVSRDVKLFVTSLVVLGVSLLLELGLGVPG